MQIMQSTSMLSVALGFRRHVHPMTPVVTVSGVTKTHTTPHADTYSEQCEWHARSTKVRSSMA